MKEKSIFSQIINREIPANIIYEDDTCIIIEDISPQAPIHYLAIPKKEISGISALSDADHGVIDHLMIAIKNEMSKKDDTDEFKKRAKKTREDIKRAERRISEYRNFISQGCRFYPLKISL